MIILTITIAFELLIGDNGLAKFRSTLSESFNKRVNQIIKEDCGSNRPSNCVNTESLLSHSVLPRIFKSLSHREGDAKVLLSVSATRSLKRFSSSYVALTRIRTWSGR